MSRKRRKGIFDKKGWATQKRLPKNLSIAKNTSTLWTRRFKTSFSSPKKQQKTFKNVFSPFNSSLNLFPTNPIQPQPQPPTNPPGSNYTSPPRLPKNLSIAKNTSTLWTRRFKTSFSSPKKQQKTFKNVFSPFNSSLNLFPTNPIQPQPQPPTNPPGSNYTSPPGCGSRTLVGFTLAGSSSCMPPEMPMSPLRKWEKGSETTPP